MQASPSFEMVSFHHPTFPVHPTEPSPVRAGRFPPVQLHTPLRLQESSTVKELYIYSYTFAFLSNKKLVFISLVISDLRRAGGQRHATP